LSELNRNINILLVEDHFLNQIATKKVLNSWSNKVSVEIAENGEAGVALFIEKNFDLILMDIQMPIMNGIEAADKIRQKSEIPIIALTANSSKQEQEKCFEVGMNDYLTKPFKPQELYTKILGLLS
jgi:CheY-like chemotaxis protein